MLGNKLDIAQQSTRQNPEFQEKFSQKQNCLILWCDLEKTNNARLENWFVRNQKKFSERFDRIHVNDDHTLNVIREKEDAWSVKTIEPVFRAPMFEDC